MKIKFLQFITDFCKKNLKRKIHKDVDFCHILLNKKNGLKKKQSIVNTLAIGSSHCAYSIIPEEFNKNIFNLGVTSQDLFGSYWMYKNIIDDLPNLKSVILFYSFFLNGYDLSKTSEQWRCYYCKYILGIPYKLKENKKIKKWLKQKELEQTEQHGDYNGYDPSTFFGSWNAEERCKGHLKNFYRNDNGLDYLDKVAQLANRFNHNLYIVIPPYRSDYRNELPGDLLEIAINKIKNLTNYNNIKICNFLYDDSFDDTDFGDTDHLLYSGACKLSKKLNYIINESE